jgi:branched-chain amino acid aminotransferase
MVRTFRARGTEIEDAGSHPDMSAASRALPHGSYTTIRTYGSHRVLRLAQHAERLSSSLPSRPLLNAATLRRALAAALGATGYAESRLRVTFAPPELYVSIEPFEPLPARLYDEGVRCVTLEMQRHNPGAKDTHFIDAATRSYAALPTGVGEGLMVAADGSILEGLSSNFFAVLRGELRTEDDRVLPGVTRSVLLELARDLVPLRLEAVRRAQLGEVSEAFVTSVSREILPVVGIDGVVLGNGRPGLVTCELMRRFAALVQREAEALATR